MNILVAGKGGREHAIIRALHDSPSAPTLFAAPGSDAIGTLAQLVPTTDIEEIITFMKENRIDLCVAGEESYLAKGLADRCRVEGIPIWGPVQESAQLESSKLFAKEFLVRHNIPTGGYAECTTIEDARAAITGLPTVLKYNGLAAGKGVAVCTDDSMVDEFLDTVFTKKQFGDDAVFVEEFLTGPEVSVICAVSDGEFFLFTPARDYKRLGDGDAGPNTGGMGAVASRALIPAEQLAYIEDHLVKPVVAGLVKDNLDYRGFLYFGIMLTPTGPQVLEFNCRFGDPEAQAVLPLIDGDFAQFLFEGAQGKINPSLISCGEDWSICLVRASRGYPATSSKGEVITGLDDVTEGRVYHAGTKLDADGNFTVNGGRVLAVSCRGPDRLTTVAKAYHEFAKVDFDGSQMRSDIGTANF